MVNKEKSIKIKASKSDKTYNFACNLYLWFLLIIILFPILNIISSSFSDPVAVISGRVTIFPVEPTLMAYEAVFQSDALMSGFGNSVFYTLIGTSINLVMTVAFAYPLSRKDFVGRKGFMFLVTFTMYFSGGLIPTYLVVSGFNMVNTVWALVIPGCVAAYFVIICRTFFMSNIPDELTEAAFIDGCGDIRTLVSIVLPNSKAIIAVMTLMFAVNHWNGFFSALIYIDDSAKFPLQLVLRDILIQNSVDKQMLTGMDIEDEMTRQYVSELLKYSTIVVSSLPMMIAYPFAQKHFIKGVMIGSIKG